MGWDLSLSWLLEMGHCSYPATADPEAVMTCRAVLHIAGSSGWAGAFCPATLVALDIMSTGYQKPHSGFSLCSLQVGTGFTLPKGKTSLKH